MAKFQQSTWKSQNWDFYGILSWKVEKVWAKNPQRSYLSWQWTMTQNLKRNWLVTSKLTWGFWQILTCQLESLKNFHFNRLLLSKVYIVWAKNYKGVIFHETEEGYQIWRGINLSLQNWHKEFDKIWPEHSKVSKIFTLMGSFWGKYIWDALRDFGSVTIWYLHGRSSACEWMLTLCSTFISFLSVCMS